MNATAPRQAGRSELEHEDSMVIAMHLAELLAMFLAMLPARLLAVCLAMPVTLVMRFAMCLAMPVALAMHLAMCLAMRLAVQVSAVIIRQPCTRCSLAADGVHSQGPAHRWAA